MAPKSKFNKNQIIDAAFEIARTEGIDGITIRKVADKLGSSIAPIYVNFKDADELIKEVVNKTFEVNRQLVREQNTGSPFRDIGAASLRFAKEYSALFRDLVIKKNDYIQNLDQDEDMLVELMKKDPMLEGLSEDELRNILLKMRIFQIGLNLMVANDLLPNEFNEEKMNHMLSSTARDIISAAHIRKTGNGKD